MNNENTSKNRVNLCPLCPQCAHYEGVFCRKFVISHPDAQACCNFIDTSESTQDLLKRLHRASSSGNISIAAILFYYKNLKDGYSRADSWDNPSNLIKELNDAGFVMKNPVYFIERDIVYQEEEDTKVDKREDALISSRKYPRYISDEDYRKLLNNEVDEILMDLDECDDGVITLDELPPGVEVGTKQVMVFNIRKYKNGSPSVY